MRVVAGASEFTLQISDAFLWASSQSESSVLEPAVLI